MIFLDISLLGKQGSPACREALLFIYSVVCLVVGFMKKVSSHRNFMNTAGKERILKPS